MQENKLIQKPVAVGVILFLVIVAVIYIESNKPQPVTESFGESDINSTGSNSVNADQQAVDQQIFSPNPDKEGKYDRAPELVGTWKWVNSEPLKINDLRGKVVLIDFLTFSCINCLRTLPYLKDWHSKYADKGLVIIGVHTPEF